MKAEIRSSLKSSSEGAQVTKFKKAPCNLPMAEERRNTPKRSEPRTDIFFLGRTNFQVNQSQQFKTTALLTRSSPNQNYLAKNLQLKTWQFMSFSGYSTMNINKNDT